MFNRIREAVYGPAYSGRVYGILAEFSDPGALYHAAEGVRDAGYKWFDTYSPFPIHGMDKAMGLGQSVLGKLVFVGGAVGCFAGYLMQWWMGEVDYALNISGKPFFAFEPSIPIMFELTVLFSALTAVVGMLALNGLPKPYNPLFYSKRFQRSTDDGFFLHIEARDPSFDQAKVQALLVSLGAHATELIEDLETTD
jgi:hypothetical protein